MTPYEAFWPNTPGGYTPVLADAICRAKLGKSDPAAAAARGRKTALLHGHTGTLQGRPLSKRAGSIVIRNVSKASVSFALLTRDEALAQGFKRYFTGEPCSRGHLSPRYTSGTGCCDCVNMNARVSDAKKRRVAA